MTSRSFTLLIGVVVALGVSLGGAFVGGIALGKSQEAEAAQNGPLARPTSTLGGPSSEQFDGASLDLIRQRIQSGDATPEELAQLRQGFQSGQGFGGQSFGGQRFGGQGFGGQRFSGRGGLSGTIEKIEGNTITVNTPQGPLMAAVGADTTIQMFAAGTLADLLEGMRVTVFGQRGEDGAVQATSILLVSEGAEGLLDGGFLFGAGQQHDETTDGGTNRFGGDFQHDQPTTAGP